MHGRIVSSGETADDVILLVYRAPHSYGGEDTVEIQGHGGSMAAKRILRAVLDAGARPAEPGEFSKRAFLNGRMDLLQAEAVCDLIRSRSDRAAAAALEQLQGVLSRDFNACYDAVLGVASEIEATLDFGDDELPTGLMDDIVCRLGVAEQMLKKVLDGWDEGHLLREGARVVIAGRPNVGKSTLLNALLGIDKAIVTHIPGTTRDVIEDQIVINGYPVSLVDTAGLRETDCEIEKEGIRRARGAMQRADIVIYMLDATRTLEDDDVHEISAIPRDRAIIVVNKTDLGTMDTSVIMTDRSVLYVSMKKMEDAEKIREAILQRLDERVCVHHHAVISERHRLLLVSAMENVAEAKITIGRAVPDPTLSASRLRAALEALGEGTGRVYHNELLNSIFSRFCIGK
jgi:tRNA modification GTPase